MPVTISVGCCTAVLPAHACRDMGVAHCCIRRFPAARVGAHRRCPAVGASRAARKAVCRARGDGREEDGKEMRNPGPLLKARLALWTD